jgi:hypothetical protein
MLLGAAEFAFTDAFNHTHTSLAKKKPKPCSNKQKASNANQRPKTEKRKPKIKRLNTAFRPNTLQTITKRKALYGLISAVPAHIANHIILKSLIMTKQAKTTTRNSHESAKPCLALSQSKSPEAHTVSIYTVSTTGAYTLQLFRTSCRVAWVLQERRHPPIPEGA